MKLRIILQLVAFIVVVAFHFIISIWHKITPSEMMPYVEETSYFVIYMNSYFHLPGIAYGLMASLYTYGAMKIIELREKKITGLIVAIIFSTVIFMGGYYLLWSALMMYFVNKMGWVYLSVRVFVPIVFAVISAITGYIWIFVKSRRIARGNI